MMKSLADISSNLRKQASDISEVRQSFSLKQALKSEDRLAKAFDAQAMATLFAARKGFDDPSHVHAAGKLTQAKSEWKQSLIALKSELEAFANA